MATYPEKKDAVLAQYFTQYLSNINPGIDLFNRLIPQHATDGTLNIMHTMFLCSVIDYFGKIMRVGYDNNDTPTKSGQAGANFVFFVEHFFPRDVSCKADILYKLFRNGVMHQFFPKASSVFWSNDVAYNNLFDDDNGTIRMNNLTLSNIICNAIGKIKENIQNDTMQNEVEAIYTHLIINHYGFDDHAELAKLEAKYAAAGSTFYHPCP